MSNQSEKGGLRNIRLCKGGRLVYSYDRSPPDHHNLDKARTYSDQRQLEGSGTGLGFESRNGAAAGEGRDWKRRRL